MQKSPVPHVIYRGRTEILHGFHRLDGIKKWKDEENQQTFAMNFDDYAGMLLRKDAQGNSSPALGFVINPFGGNIVVTRDGSRHDRREAESSRETGTSRTRCTCCTHTAINSD